MVARLLGEDYSIPSRIYPILKEAGCILVDATPDMATTRKREMEVLRARVNYLKKKFT